MVIITDTIKRASENHSPPIHFGVGDELALKNKNSITPANTLQSESSLTCFLGTCYDVGDKFCFMTTSINYSLTHPEVKDKLKEFIIALGKELSDNSESDKTLTESTVSVM